MNYDANLLNYFIHASLVVKAVMLILVIASVCSWSYILQRKVYLQGMNKAAKRFEDDFWSGDDLTKLYTEARHPNHSQDGISAIFQAGYKEYTRFRKLPAAPLDTVIENTKRAMQVAQMREQDKMETHLPFLAIVGSTSPYIGLFGTVWGIMQAFRALSAVQQATISMVAPGIAEALIATALGLFAAIPAVIAYNRYASEITRLINRFQAFQEEFINILIRQAQPAAVTVQLEAVE